MAASGATLGTRIYKRETDEKLKADEAKECKTVEGLQHEADDEPTAEAVNEEKLAQEKRETAEDAAEKPCLQHVAGFLRGEATSPLSLRDYNFLLIVQTPSVRLVYQ